MARLAFASGSDAQISDDHPAGYLFVVGRTYTVHTHDGQLVRGRCTMASPEQAWLTARWTTHRIIYRGILRVDVH